MRGRSIVTENCLKGRCASHVRVHCPHTQVRRRLVIESVDDKWGWPTAFIQRFGLHLRVTSTRIEIRMHLRTLSWNGACCQPRLTAAHSTVRLVLSTVSYIGCGWELPYAFWFSFTGLHEITAVVHRVLYYKVRCTSLLATAIEVIVIFDTIRLLQHDPPLY